MLDTFKVSFIVCITAALTSSPALSQSAERFPDPSKRFVMVVPYDVGGGSDQLARAMVKGVKETTGVIFDVVNKPGDAGLVAIPFFNATPPDGYTVLEHIDDATSAYAAGNSATHPARDWVPLAQTQITFSQLFIRSDNPRFNDWRSFYAYAKANPGRVVVANISYDGSMERVNMQRFADAMGLQVRQDSLNVTKERFESILYDRADVLFEQPGDVRKYLDDGSMKPILTFYNERPAAFADVPTHREVGADFDALLRYRGFYVRAGTPPDRLEYLQAMIRMGFESTSFQAFNERKYMNVIQSWRNTNDSIVLINQTVDLYTRTYSDMLAEAVQRLMGGVN